MVYNFFTVMPLFVVLFWLLLFFLRSKKNNVAQQFLMLFLGVAFLNYIAHWFYFNHNYEAYRVMDSVWVFTSLASYPLYYYYIRLLTVDMKIQYRWSWILLPAILLSLFSATLYLLMSSEEIEQFTHELLYHNREQVGSFSLLISLQVLRINLFKFLFAIQVILTLVFGLRLITDFNKRVYAFYSNVENREITKIRNLLFFLVLASTVSAISNLIGKDYFSDNPYLLAFPSIAHSIALFGISYVGYNQHFTVRDLQSDEHAGKPYANEQDRIEPGSESMTGAEYDKLFSKLEQLFEVDQLFKEPDVRISDVARWLGTNRTYVSRLIHNNTHKSFCDYVNDYRLNHAEKLLSSPEHSALLIEDVAVASGFSGNSSFYRAFVKKNGISPGKYRRSRCQTMKVEN